MGVDRGNLTWARRQWRRNHPLQCRKCGKIEPTGLIEGKCNRCFEEWLDREKQKEADRA